MMKIEFGEKWRTNFWLRYLVVGIWNTAFSVTFLYLLFFLFDNKFYEYEFAATYIICTAQSYTTQRLIVWKSSTSPKAEFSRFIVATISQYLLNSIVLYIAVNDLKLKPTYSALPIMLTITCGFYFVNRNIVFRTHKVENGKNE